MSSFLNIIHANVNQATPPNQQSTANHAADSTGASGVQTQDTNAAQQPEAPSVTPSSSSQASHTSTSPSQPHTDTTDLPRPPIFFRLPFAAPDGNPALLAFHPQPLPQREPSSTATLASSPSNHNQNQTHNQSQPPRSPNTSTAPQPSQPDSAQPASRPIDSSSNHLGTSPAGVHSHPHPDGHVPVAPLFVPFGASPLPFSFIYDPSTQTAWPIAQVTPGSPPGGPSPDAPESQQPRLVAGPPFRIILDIHFTPAPQPEQPDPQKAANYVKQLERADAELRARMARLGMGSIGGFGDSSPSAAEQDALLGCGICLDNYDTEDRPEWIDGPKTQDEAVVAVPCQGHHTLHAGCLREWLEKLPPSQWTCPFCRASISPDLTNRAAQDAISPPRSKSAGASAASVPCTTLRDEVRARERKQGWRCDAPACLPRYPLTSRSDDGHLELPETSDNMTTDLVKLAPCHHEVHLDCLCTSMRVENHLAGTSDLDTILADTDSDESTSDVDNQDISDSAQPQQTARHEQHDTVGKWVTCPTCRKECWAELPLRRRPKRSTPTSQATPLDAAVVLDAADDVERVSKSLPSTRSPDYTHGRATQDAQPKHSPLAISETLSEGTTDPEEEATVNAMLVPNAST